MKVLFIILMNLIYRQKRNKIIKMLQLFEDSIVIEEKGIYSIEKFLIARRLMYWQVYLHKTVLVADQLLIKILLRAKFLLKENINIYLLV